MRTLTQEYTQSITFRIAVLAAAAILLPLVLCLSISVGAAAVSFRDVVAVLCGFEAEPRLVQIIMNIRLPQALAAIIAGAGLAISGATMQAVLRNPLASPMTLGISNAAAFGAALTMVLGVSDMIAQNNTLNELGLSVYFARSGIALGAFACAMLATCIILLLSRVRGTQTETIILIGVALGALFSAGLMSLQYVVDETRLASIVYWTFGDTARATWAGLLVMTFGIVPISLFFLWQSWNYNAMTFGEETAMGLGVPVRRLRVLTMILASLLTAILVSLLGIIGFIGLVVPHLARLLVGSDYRFLLPCSLIFGALLLLFADTAARMIIAPRILPVSILTAFIGTPVFLALLCRKRGTSC